MLQKLVVKTAVKTVLIILGILIAVFAIFNVAFPQHMATVMESVDNYALAVKYANMRYYYTKDGMDLARCFDDSVLSHDDELIIEYGELIVGHSEYEEICLKKNELFGGRFDYNQKVKTSLSLSYYNTGLTLKAIELASSVTGTDGFAEGNALVVLSAAVRSNSDAEGAAEICKVLDVINPTQKNEVSYLNQVKTLLKSIAK